MASSAKSGMVDSICLAKQADLEAVAFSGTGRRLARAAIGFGPQMHIELICGFIYLSFVLFVHRLD